MSGDGLIHVVGTGRKVAALPAENAGQGELVGPDRRVGEATRQPLPHAAAVVAAAAFVTASTTASKVSKVDACRAL